MSLFNSLQPGQQIVLEEYYNYDSLAIDVFLEKYAVKTPDGLLLEKHPYHMYTRLCATLGKFIKKVPKERQVDYETRVAKQMNWLSYMLKSKKFIFGGSILFGLGNPYVESSLGNCFVIHNPNDSYSGIMKTDQEQIQLMKRRGGVGHDISHLRPKGAKVNNAALTSTGAVSFMERFSNSTREVAQGGRRGALMLTMEVGHPDIKDFITAKNDLTKITGANISVKITDEFLNRVIERDPEAEEILHLLAEQAWKTGEPGVIFWDTVIRNSPADLYPNFQTVSTNPCQPTNAIISLGDKLSTIGDLKVGDLIYTSEGMSKVVRKESAGLQKVYKYSTTCGYVLCTEDHQIIQNGEKVKAVDAESIDLLCNTRWYFLGPEDVPSMISILDGLLIGGGSIHKASDNLIHLHIGEDDVDYFTHPLIKDGILEHRPGLKNTAYIVSTSLTHEDLPRTYLRKVPDKYFYGSILEIKGFLKGLYSANGSVVENRVTLKSASKVLIEQVQIMLNFLDIKSYITVNKSKEVEFKNGTYTCKQSYDLNITRSRIDFLFEIGFLQQYKTDKLRKSIESSPPRDNSEKISKPITNVEYIGIEEVFNITVDNQSHTYWSGGFNIANCGELPLSPYDSCRLASLNVAAYTLVDEKDCLHHIENDAYKAQVFMDLVIDAESERIQRIISKIETDLKTDRTLIVELELWTKIHKFLLLGRRTGLGITGLADLMAHFGYVYGSEESRILAYDVMKAVAIGSYKASIDLACTLGSFPDYEREREFVIHGKKKWLAKDTRTRYPNHPFLKEIWYALPIEYRDKWFKYGRRNISNLTIAPNGSISMLVGTTSGMEPLFKAYYNRRKKTNDDTEYDFVDASGDKWITYNVIHNKLMSWYSTQYEVPFKKAKEKLEKMSEEELEELFKTSPYYGSEAHDVSPLDKIKVQEALQHWVDHSISMTINLPKEATVEDVRNVFLQAWVRGCKGATVYRDGSRDGVLITRESKTTPLSFIHDAPKRPKTIPCVIHQVASSGEKYTVIVGFLENLPFEIFAYKHSEDLAFKPKGNYWARKVHRGRYDIINEEGVVVLEDITNTMSPAEEVITRLASMGLRHGADIKFITEQLSKSKENLSAFSKVLARILKKYVKDGDKVSGNECPECNATLVYESGCVRCSNCTYELC